jgi:hypothetical protein
LAGTYGDISGLVQFDRDNAADREARIAGMLADPSTSASIRELVSNPLYGRAVADYLYAHPNVSTPAGVNDDDRAEYVRLLGGVWANATPAASVAPAGRPRGIVNGQEIYLDDGSPVPGGYSAKADAERQLREQGYSHPTVKSDGTIVTVGPPDHPAAPKTVAVDIAPDGSLSTAGFGGVLGWVLAAGLVGAVLRQRRLI